MVIILSAKQMSTGIVLAGEFTHREPTLNKSKKSE
jgi:hypothetical protein